MGDEAGLTGPIGVLGAGEIALLSAEVTRPERLIGMPFMNPPWLTTAVEVMRPAVASPAAFERVPLKTATPSMDGRSAQLAAQQEAICQAVAAFLARHDPSLKPDVGSACDTN